MLRSMGSVPGRGARTLVAVVALIPVVVALALTAFAWPSARLAPRDLPVGVAGPPPAVAAIQRQLARRGDAFAVHVYADEAAARAAIGERAIYGAIVVAPGGATVAAPGGGVSVLTASAASPLVAQLLRQAATATPAGSAEPQGGASVSRAEPQGGASANRVGPGAAAAPPRVVDVVPADPDDPRGAALSASVLPLVLAGLLTGLLIGLRRRPGLGQAAALLLAAVLAGLAAAGIAHGWLGILGGEWLANAGVLALTVLAIAATAAGLLALLGRAGLALAAAAMVLLGNPLSGVPSAPELLPQPFGLIGQLLPPGAGGSLLRSTAFFDGNGAARPLTVLASWAALGLAACWAGGLRRPRPATASAAAVRPLAAGSREGFLSG